MSDAAQMSCSRCWGTVELVVVGARLVCRCTACGHAEPAPAAVEVRAAGTPPLPGLEDR